MPGTQMAVRSHYSQLCQQVNRDVQREWGCHSRWGDPWAGWGSLRWPGVLVCRAPQAPRVGGRV